MALLCAAVLLARASAGSAAAAAYPRAQQPTGTVPLKVVADAQLAPGDIVTLETLSGALARTTPEIYRVSTTPDAGDSYALWLRQLVSQHQVKTDLTFLNNFTGLLQSMRGRIRGFVQFKADGGRSVNAAVTFCAGTAADASGVVVAASEAATIAVLKSIGAAQIRDLSSSTPEAVYSDLSDGFSKRMASFQPPSKSADLAAYAVFARAPTIEWQGNTGGSAVRPILEDIARAGDGGVAMGWGPEDQYVAHLASYGMYVHASDWAKDVAPLSNMAAHASVPRKPLPPLAASYSQAAVLPAAEAVHTVTFLVTDGDNIQWMLGGWATDGTWLGSKQVGEVPAGFTTSPALAALGPVVLEYANGIASKGNTSFVCGPSGVGYTFPDALSGAARGTFADLTADYLAKSGLRIVNVIGHNNAIDVLEPLLAGADALFYYSFGDYYVGEHGSLRWVDGKPIVGGRFALWGNSTKQGEAMGVDAMVEALAAQTKDSTSASGYSLIPVHAWSHTFADVVSAVRKLEARGGVRVVTPEVFVQQLIANVKPRSCPTPFGSFSSSCSGCTTDPSSCVMTCKCRGPKGATEAKCDLRCCNDLANSDGALTCGGKTCPLSC
eukprot:TRINITY_DN664_c0_g2_i1.p1 TRINITY_DN664_c0_g2~~TRINITY_DN664_c0_g2_i1.p1  ORF type:complete len:634 (+),score=135.48 TRINITY_DN664_c0_g2_i1:78-1904(+)